MTDEEDSNNKPVLTGVFSDLNSLRSEVSDLKRKLNLLNSEKESWYKKRSECLSKLSALVKDIKAVKTERDEKTGNVKLIKEDRDKLNALIREKIAKFNELKSARDKLGKTDNPHFIKKKMNELESHLETNVISFEKEKKIMSEIKKLKKEYDASKANSVVYSQIKELSSEIDSLKKKSFEKHKEITTIASESQAKHESMKEESKEIRDLRKLEREAFSKFSSLKEEFNKNNAIFKEKLAKLKEIGGEVERVKNEKIALLSRDKEKFLEMKRDDAEKKLKVGKKLTTADLLAFQKN